MVRAKKNLGQHFLKDLNIAKKIVNGLTLSDKPIHVLEIGPGTGVLTRFLLEIPQIDLTLIEIDKESVEYLNLQYPQLHDKIISDDFLAIDLNKFSQPFAIIGNFPYNISSQIFFKILENRKLVDEVVCMIQKEVAERIVSLPGSKDYGILSVLLQAHYKTSMLFHVKPHLFIPPPKVMSTVIRLNRLEHRVVDYSEDLFKQIVKTAFNQRRKMLSNSLSSLINDRKIEIPFATMRPEQLSVNDFIELTKVIERFE
jgi:16S rRNA (adenine1518-N6/adenine1519-N6)-dimethyltransferase